MGTSFNQPRVFDDAEAQTFAGMWAGFDIGNASEAEAMAKGRILRRKAEEKNLRLIEVLELPEIRAAIDHQMSPKRGPCPACEAAQNAAEAAQAKLAEREKQTRKLIEDFEARLKEKARAARQRTQHHRGIAEFLGFAWGYPEWRMALLLALILGSPWLLMQEFSMEHAWTPYVLIVLGVLQLMWWAAAEIDETGWAQLLLKLALLAGGFAAVVAAQFAFAWIVLGVVALLTATRLINNLCERAMRVPALAAVAAFFR
jgi:hypothetical protein